MQRGSLIRSERKQGPAVWQFRWSDKGPEGQRIYRKRVIGTVDEYVDSEAARRLVKDLIVEFTPSDLRMKPGTMTVTELCKHFQLRELTNDNNWRSYSTKRNYFFCLKRWIIPRWGIAYAVVGRCKTESSQKPVPVHPILADALSQWRQCCHYRKSDDWIFASEHHQGRKPYWGQAIMRKLIRPAAQKLGIQKRFGWHTFRHTFSTLLRSVGTDFKVMQELLRHSSLRSTMDIYTQAVTPAKREAQAAVLSLVFSSETGSEAFPVEQEIATT